MIFRRDLRPALAVLVLPVLGGCLSPSPARPGGGASGEGSLISPSTQRVVGHIVAVDPGLGFAFVELSPGAPVEALAPGTALITRSESLAATGRVEATRHRRLRTLGTRIVAGRPSVGDEVTWPLPGDRFPALQSGGAAYVPTP